MRLRYFYLVFFLCLNFEAFASHIIGGEVTYECLGDGRYLIDYHLYRDCGPGSIDFDDISILTYFVCDSNGNCEELMQSDGETLRSPPSSIRAVDPPPLECLVAPVEACVEEAIYSFEIDGLRDVFTPMVDMSYVIVFQRCCRNETILNIENPSISGSSFVIEINPASQASCNSSPVFNNFPPTIICNNEPINFDHSAMDPDGDSLVYSFCSPLLGGGTAGDPITDPMGNSDTCDGSAPNPACPNFNQPVNYIEPTYSAAIPMAGDPVVAIDPATGLITGIPNIQGQFVVGVCVEEYRNGEFLGAIQRDFQFNVAACIQNVTAQIQSDDVTEITNLNGEVVLRNFNFTMCGQESVQFINESFDREFIDSITWEFDEGTILSDDWDAEVLFPGQGNYTGTLTLNPGSPQCIDSATISVEILPALTADFNQSFDSCIIGPVSFIDSSFTEGQAITDWEWDFGDGGQSSEQDPIYQYANSGNFDIFLTVRDVNGCEDSETVNIIYSPTPQFVSISQSTDGGCSPTAIQFTNNSTPFDNNNNLLWKFGDGNTSEEASPIHVYEEPGVYAVSLSIETPSGCEVAEEFNDLITILPSPTAGFSLNPTELSTVNPTVNVTNEAFNNDTWLYQFDNQGTSTQASPSFTFRDTGLQQIVQIVSATNGCRDTAVQFIDIIPFVEWFMPNAFTPTRDGINDIFIGNGSLLGATDFVFTIWNRWGELIFETNDINEGWNGRKNNVGQDSPAGVYIYVLSYRTPRGETVRLDGFSTLIR